jgi:nucleoside diphosphate kinase
VSQLPPEVGFVLFKPDLFYRQLLVPVLQFLKGHGFMPLSFLAARVSDTHYKKMYSHQFLWEVDDWYHNRQLYAFGPGLGVLLRHEKGRAQELLSQIKGAALPKDRREGSLRKKFLSKSRVFNLIHVPDNRYQAEKEALHWFGGSFSFGLLTSEEMVSELECFNCFEAQFRLDPEEAFLIAKLRLFHACRNSKNCPERLKVPLKQAALFYHRWKDALLSETSYEGIEGTLLPDFQREEAVLCQQLVKACEIDLNRRQAIEALFAATTTKYVSNFFWILDEWNVYLSELERYLILCRLKYNPSFAKCLSSH